MGRIARLRLAGALSSGEAVPGETPGLAKIALAVVASMLLADPVAGLATGSEIQHSTWEWSSEGWSAAVPRPVLPGTYWKLKFRGRRVRAIAVDRDQPEVVWLHHLAGSPRPSEALVRWGDAFGVRILATLPQRRLGGHPDESQLTADELQLHVTERLKDARAVAQWASVQDQCLVLAGTSAGSIAALAMAAETRIDGLVLFLSNRRS